MINSENKYEYEYTLPNMNYEAKMEDGVLLVFSGSENGNGKTLFTLLNTSRIFIKYRPTFS